MGKFWTKCHEVGMHIKTLSLTPHGPTPLKVLFMNQSMVQAGKWPNLHALPIFGNAALTLKHIFSCISLLTTVNFKAKFLKLFFRGKLLTFHHLLSYHTKPESSFMIMSLNTQSQRINWDDDWALLLTMVLL